MSDQTPSQSLKKTVKTALKDTAHAARKVGEDAMQMAREESAATAVTAADWLRAEVEARAEEGKQELSRQGHRLSKAIHARAGASGYGIQQDFLSAVAGGITELSDDLRNRSISSLLTETERFAHRHPGAFALAAAVVGFAAVRFARAGEDGLNLKAAALRESPSAGTA